MVSRIILTSVIALTMCGTGFAEEKTGTQAKLVGGTFKTLAKAYVTTANIEQLKEKNIKRIESMKESWFRMRYAEVWDVVQRMPEKTRKKYNVTAGMTKSEAVDLIRSMDKKKICEIIDQAPDQVIYDEFRKELAKNGKSSEGNVMTRVSEIWNDIVGKINKKQTSN